MLTLVTVRELEVPEDTLTLAVDCELLPTVTLPKLSVAGERLTPGAAPVPLSETICVPAASLITAVPVRVPAAVGVKVKVSAQVAFAARGLDDVHVSLSAKSPLTVTLLMLKALPPLFVKVTDCELLVVFTVSLPNVTLVGERLAPGALPVPVSGITWLPSESATLIEPPRVPVTTGENVTLMVQVAPGISAPPLTHVSDSAKSPAAVTPLMLKLLVPVLVTMMLVGALVVSTTWLPKLTPEGENPIPGVIPVPVNATMCVPALSEMVTVPVRGPDAAGLKVTPTVQLALGVSGLAVTQPPVAAKSPLAVKLVTLKLLVPVLLTVTFCATLVVPTNWLAKLKVVESSPTPGATPVPVSATTWVPTLSEIAIAPFRTPTASGAKEICRVQLNPCANTSGGAQFELVTAKSPLAAKLFTVRLLSPVLVKVML